ncbi:MAG TPA: hypothetical protein PK640_01930 [Verrucomicrobiota bacterium]|nr:hypothetical protein [Verrucomicrobiota bacterium]
MAADLTKKLPNPITNLIGVPIQSDRDVGQVAGLGIPLCRQHSASEITGRSGDLN